MAECRTTDPAAGAADSRMAAYFDGKHHPHQALPPRTGYVATANGTIIGYIAGHRTQRFGCDGEVQYLFVALQYRRQGIAGGLLRSLAHWFKEQRIAKVCVDVNLTSPGASAFYLSCGATPINKHWYVWQDIGIILN
jgi:GNAT superfamily N-acetyltransferase